jgi:general secretion pathway protein D
MRRASFAAAAAMACVLSAPGSARAQQDGPTAIDGSIEHAPRRPDEMVTLSLQNAELADLVRVMSEMTGKRFLVSAAPKSFQATIVSPQKVTVAEAYQAFLAVLAANHLTVVPRGRFYKIVDAQDAVHEAPVASARDATPEERYVTYVHRVGHISAEEVTSGVLSKLASHDGAVIPYGNVLLLTDTGANVQRMLRVLDEIDVAQAEDQVWLEPLQYVPAADVKKELDELLDLGPKGDKAGKGAPPGGDSRVTKIVALDRPNALLVVGSPAGYARLLELVRSVDVAIPVEGQMHVVMLEHADAKKIVGPINEALSAAGGGSGGNAAAAGNPAAAANKVLEAPVKVSAEETNNALIVTANAHDFAAVREVIRRLDQPRRQVYIEAVVLDLSVKRATALDTAFHGFDSPGGGALAYGGSDPMKSLLLPTDPTSLQALVLGVRGPDVPVPSFLQSTLGTTSIPGIGFFLDAYATTADSDILSTPHILATDNTPAELHVQLNTSLQRNAPSYGVPSAGGAGATGAASAFAMYSAPASANYGKIGPQIKVTPHIDDSDEVRLDVAETISDIGDTHGTLGTVDFTERGAQTTLTVKDGHTAVIGGLVRDRVVHSATKIPLLGDIPVIGALFRSTSDATEKGNLVLVLTPHIIRSEEDMRRIFEQRMQERQEFLDHYFAFRDGAPVGFDPARGHGMLAAVRAAYDDVAARKRLETPAPGNTVAAHEPHEAMGMPNGHAELQAQPAKLDVTPPARTIEHVEK